MTHNAAPARETAGPRYEARDANVRRLLQLGVALCVVIVIALFGVARLMSYLASRQPPSPLPSPLAVAGELPPRPRLQITPRLDLAEKRKAEDATLNSYGWIDRTGGMVHIPIERAMDLVAERATAVGDRPAGSAATPRAPDRDRGDAR